MAGDVVTRASMDPLAQDEYARPTHRRKKMRTKKSKKRKPAPKKKKARKGPPKPSPIVQAMTARRY